MDELNVGNLGYPNTYAFSVKIERTQTASAAPWGPSVTQYTLEYPFQLVSVQGNSVYESTRIDYSDFILEPIECDWSQKPICCNPKSFFEFNTEWKVTHSKTNSSTGSITLSSSFSISDLLLGIDIGPQLSSSYTVSETTANAVLSSYSSVIKERIHGLEGACRVPGFEIRKVALLEETYEPNCDGDDVLVSSQKFYVPYQVLTSLHCVQESQNDCPPIPLPNINKGSNNFAALSCEGFIDVDIAGEDNLTIGWTGPNGFSSNDFYIEDLEIGIYTYTISNECCETITGEVELCDNMEIGPWEYNETTEEYCRVLTCDGIGAVGPDFMNASDCEIFECVVPEVNTSYNGFDCVETHTYQGEVLNQIVGAAIEETTYDEFSGMCAKVKYCGTEMVDVENQFATYGFWEYDSFNETCTRTIYCFGELMEGLNDTKEPEIEETYNELTGLCETTVYCDITPIFQPPSFPIVNGPWNWSEWNGCSKPVQCDITSETITVEGTEAFYNWNFNSNTNLCEAAVSCDNETVFGAVHTEFPGSIGSWSFNASNPFEQQCVRQVYCGANNQLIYDYTSPEFVDSGIPCPQVPEVNIHYVYCNGVNTGATVNCFTSGGGGSRFQSGNGNNELEIGNSETFSPQIRIVPNPTSGSISIISNLDLEISLHDYKIFNPVGQLMKSGHLDSQSIDLSGLNKGIYLISITDGLGNEIHTQKIVKL